MKFLINKRQYKILLKEDHPLIEKIISEHSDSSFIDFLPTLDKFGFTIINIKRNQTLNNFITNKFKTYYDGILLDGVYNGIGKDLNNTATDNTITIINHLIKDYVIEDVKEITDIKNPINKILKLNDYRNKILRSFRYYGSEEEAFDFLTDLLQGTIDDAISYLFESGKSIREIIKNLSILKKNYRYDDDSYNYLNSVISDIGEKHGYTLVRKPLQWSFEKGGGRVQQIIDYIKEQPKLPKKTRKGWMEYVGEDPRRKGWNSTLWRAVQDAGIIEKVRDGVSYTYRLGPNAEAFETGKLIGY